MAPEEREDRDQDAAQEPSGREPSAREPSAREPSAREPSAREPAAPEPTDAELFRASVERGPVPRPSRRGKARPAAEPRRRVPELEHRPFAEALRDLAREVRAAPPPPRPQPRPLLPPPGPQPKPLPPPPELPPPEDEGRFFEREMAGVRPLPERRRVAAERQRADRVIPVDHDAEVLAELADLVAGRGVFDSTFSEEHIEGLGEGLDRKLLRNLRRGGFSVAAHLDLHGLTRAEARPRVEQFLNESRRRGHRCVLLVHGRGLHSKEGIPVLKEAVGSWLLRGRIARIVLAFCSARPADGGFGALYVLLRR